MPWRMSVDAHRSVDWFWIELGARQEKDRCIGKNRTWSRLKVTSKLETESITSQTYAFSSGI